MFIIDLGSPFVLPVQMAIIILLGFAVVLNHRI